MFENIVYNSYYQWVPLYLTFLAFFFYLPRYIWLKMEGGLMKLFRKGTTARFIEDQDEKREKLVQFFCRNIHNKWEKNCINIKMKYVHLITMTIFQIQHLFLRICVLWVSQLRHCRLQFLPHAQIPSLQVPGLWLPGADERKYILRSLGIKYDVCNLDLIVLSPINLAEVKICLHSEIIFIWRHSSSSINQFGWSYKNFDCVRTPSLSPGQHTASGQVRLVLTGQAGVPDALSSLEMYYYMQCQAAPREICVDWNWIIPSDLRLGEKTQLLNWDVCVSQSTNTLQLWSIFTQLATKVFRRCSEWAVLRNDTTRTMRPPRRSKVCN